MSKKSMLILVPPPAGSRHCAAPDRHEHLGGMPPPDTPDTCRQEDVPQETVISSRSLSGQAIASCGRNAGKEGSTFQTPDIQTRGRILGTDKPGL